MYSNIGAQRVVRGVTPLGNARQLRNERNEGIDLDRFLEWEIGEGRASKGI